MTLVDLRTEASAEARRLTSARELIRNGDAEALSRLEADAAWIAFARPPRLRRSLAGRICLVWRVVFEDSSGRPVESRLVPLLVHGGRRRPQTGQTRRNTIRLLLRDAEHPIRARVEGACQAWASAATSAARAFTSARQARQDAIDRLPGPPHVLSQPGLFDRRAERDREAEAAASAETVEAARDRAQSINAQSTIARRPARLLLVLVP